MKPTEMPQAREGLMSYGAIEWPLLYAHSIERGEQGMWPGNLDAEAGGALLAKREISRLSLADLYHVSEAMTSLACGAADSMPIFALQREDLPSDYGLIVFDQAIAMNDILGVHVVAACWGLWKDAPQRFAPDGAVWVTWYTDRDMNNETAVAEGRMTRAQAISFSGSMPPLILENEMQIPFSPDHIEGEADNVYGRMAKVLLTTWTLMQQQNLSAEHIEIPPRSARRRMVEREPDLMKVRVITLRTTSSGESSKIHGNREYRHRWIVRGHWRQQWYATREVHRPVWIAPHVKGPDDAPILGGEKVYAWRQ